MRNMRKKTSHLTLQWYMPNCNGTEREQTYPALFSHSLVNSCFSWMIYINKCAVTGTKEDCMGAYQQFLRLVKVSHISLGYHHRSGKVNKEIYTFICSFLFPGQIQ